MYYFDSNNERQEVYIFHLLSENLFTKVDSSYFTGVAFSKSYLCFIKSGRYHNTIGPAKLSYNGTNQWYINGAKILVNSQKEFISYLKLKAFQ